MPDSRMCHPIARPAVVVPPPAESNALHAQDDAAKWFALAVRPRHDKAVSRMLENKGYQAFVPLYQKRSQYSARFKDCQLPLFPGYVFCRFNPLVRLPILTTPGVIHLVGTGKTPTPVDDREMASLQTALSAQLAARPLPFLEKGEKVRITGGPLAGVEGIVLNFKQCLRLVLSISILQRSVMVEIDRDRVSREGGVRPVLAV